MNWLVFAILAYLAYALQLVLAPLLGVEWGGHEIEPMLLLILLVFVGLQARAIAVGYAALALGVLTDVYLDQHDVGLIGPWAIGFLAAGYAMVQLRNLLFRDSVFTIAIMTLIAGVFALLVATTIHALRGVPLFGNEPAVGFSAANQLYRGFGMLLYTAVIAMPVGYALLQSRALWGFTQRGSR